MNTIENLRQELLSIGAAARYADRLVTAAVSESVCVWCDADTEGGPAGAKIHILACEKAPHRKALAEKDAQIAAFDAQVADNRRQADKALGENEGLVRLVNSLETEAYTLRNTNARLTQEVEGLRSQLDAREKATLPFGDPSASGSISASPLSTQFVLKPRCACGYTQMMNQDAVHSEDGKVHTPAICSVPEKQLVEEAAGPAIEQAATPAAADANDGPPAVTEQVALPDVKPRRGRPPDTRCRALGCPATDATNGWPGSGTAYFCAVHGTVEPASIRLEWNRAFKAANAKPVKKAAIESAPASEATP